MIELPDPSSVLRVADWLELSVAASGDALSKAATTAVIESVAGEEPSETFVSSVWRELEYRHRLYQNPCFEVRDRTVEPRQGTECSAEYVACLLWSLFGVQGVTRYPARLFERITCKAVERYLSGNAFVFGWPSDLPDEDDEDSQIKRKIKKAADDLGEKFIEAPRAQFNDRGVDVIGWIPFAEGRSGQIVMLLQCTAGRDWKNKAPVPIDSWREYIHWSSAPIPAFAIPGIVKENEWHEKTKDKGLIFDRARIVNLLGAGTDDGELADELNTWMRQTLADIEI
ncbi:MAG TPA: hypothetical protein VJH03_12170 [Blastocatellia bacterium]|nr:hypothetical protein [Blastocatellia bacterium]